MNNFTLVGYLVSYHNDVFSKGKDLLENKMCFAYDNTEISQDVGRGGCGSNKFVFALLDWTSNASSARRVQYQLNGDQLKENDKLTKRKWRDEFGSEWTE